MKKIILYSIIPFLMWACDDSTSASSNDNTAENYSSSISLNLESSESISSSSSELAYSSTRQELSSSSELELSSSSTASSSSNPISSSETSSSSNDEASSSSEENSSSSLEESSREESSSSFIKHDYFNPNVDYGELTDKRDGQTYKTVTIGDQVWMAENLNYKYHEGVLSFCFENSADSCAKYGHLYLWSSAVDSLAEFSTEGKGCGYEKPCNFTTSVRGICPEGWHLPSQNEWDILLEAVGGNETAGENLKTTEGWQYDRGLGGNCKNPYGFSVLPAGRGSNKEDNYNIGLASYFWTSTEVYERYAMYKQFSHDQTKAREDYIGKNTGFSIRCVKD